jgi:leader peptidase (prepilin peptidase)/N-methyltransferase
VEPVLAALFVLFGLAFGSFLNVCIYRIPRALEAAQEEGTELSAWREMRQSLAAWRSVTEPARSFCPQCGHGIRWYDNVPVVSWLVLGGRCRDCGGRISFRYTAVEALTGLLFLACYAGFGPTLEAVKYCLFTLLLVPLIFTDAEHKLLPDTYTVPGVLLGLAFSLAVPVNDVAPLLAGNGAAGAGWLSLADAALGAAVGSGFLYGVGLLYRLARGQEGMGLGDVKLMAMVGAFVGARLAVLTIFAACILGLLFALAMLPCFWRSRVRLRMRRNRETAAVARRRAWRSLQLMRFYAVPYGVFLGMAALLAVFFGAAIFHWYITRYF